MINQWTNGLFSLFETDNRHIIWGKEFKLVHSTEKNWKLFEKHKWTRMNNNTRSVPTQIWDGFQAHLLRSLYSPSSPLSFLFVSFPSFSWWAISLSFACVDDCGCDCFVCNWFSYYLNQIVWFSFIVLFWLYMKTGDKI